jgi:hypothetical protein
MKLITSFVNENIPLLHCPYISSSNPLLKEEVIGKETDFGSNPCMIQQNQQFSEFRLSKRNVFFLDHLFYDAGWDGLAGGSEEFAQSTVLYV